MSKLRWFRPKEESLAGGQVSFRRNLLGALAIWTFYGAWILAPWTLRLPGPTVEGFHVVVWGTVLALAVFFLRRYDLQAAGWLFVLGGLAASAMVPLAFQREITLALLLVPVLTAGLIFGIWASLAIGGLASGLVLWLAPQVTPNPAPGMWIVLIVAVGIIGSIAQRALALGDYYEQELALRQQQLIRELRQHQGELNRTLKALDEAYVSLRRTTNELDVARRVAEEARVLKEQFVANVSHELRTPLNLITGFVEMMYLAPETYDGVGWTPDLQGDIRELYRASRHLQSLVNDILDLSRIDAARLPIFRELVDIRTVIADSVETVAPLFRQRGLSYRVECPDKVPALFIDRTRIRQVLLNLLNNAVRFTDRGGVTLGVQVSPETVTVSVSDTGVGISPDQLEIVFERFRQASASLRGRGGAGLGLALSRQFVELHGGRMWAESQPGEGSTFYFALPLPGTLPQTVTLERTPYPERVAAATAPIVVVESDPSIAEMLGRYLGNRPIVPAADTSTAEELIEAAHPAAIIVNQPPTVPLAEWLGTVGQASERYSVPVLRCSLPSPSWLRQSGGLDDCLTKPVTREMLASALLKYCAQPADILVVDDDPGFVRLMMRTLGTLERARQVWAAYSAEQALRLVREHRPGLILLDLLLPGESGLSLVHTLRHETDLGAVHIVAVTATSYAEDTLLQRGIHFTLTQAGGITPGRFVDLINATLPMVQPNYVVEDRT